GDAVRRDRRDGRPHRARALDRAGAPRRPAAAGAAARPRPHRRRVAGPPVGLRRPQVPCPPRPRRAMHEGGPAVAGPADRECVMADLRLTPARASLGFRSGPAAALAALLLAAAPAAAQSGVLPDTGASALVGRCDLTVDGTPYRGCACRMMISAAGGGYALSGLNVGCQGQ